MMLKDTLKISVLVFTLCFGAKAFAGVNEVKECLAQALAKENPVFQVADAPTPEERFSRYLVMICSGKSAQNLFESLSGKPIEGEWAGKTRGEFKYLGEDGGASMCYHINTNSEGRIVDDYNCSIRLNVASQNLGKTKESEMQPFILKAKEEKPKLEMIGFKN